MANFRYSHLYTKKTGSTAVSAAVEQLNQAEIALAISEGSEKILFKNTASNVVTVPTDAQVDKKVNVKVDRQLSGANGTALIFNESDGGGAKFEHNDGTWSFCGVNDGGQNGIAGQVYALKKNASNKYEGTRLDVTLNGMYYTYGDAASSDRLVEGNEIATKGNITTAVSDFFDNVEYVASSKTINFYNGSTLKAQIDATDFVIDGMVENVEIKDVEISGETVSCLVVTFNLDSGAEEIDIPISEIFNASNYYTKSEVDTMIDGEASARTEAIADIADMISDEEDRAISAETELQEAISELEANKLDASAYTPTDLSNYYDKDEVDAALDEKLDASAYTEIMDAIDNDGRVISSSLNDLNDRVSAIDSSLDGIKLKKITQSDYDNLVNGGTVDANTLYIVTD